ncbi:MAG: SpoVR family protein [Desulfitobacteriaceae bacterium]|nr:SpoVR family protein [Desulfitobacteriaceae bacterium]MDD4345772.1 SpoVR family protein [Desulfitobacteriaceae bacterium]MDD4400977.1 SpoVR family protein [Desulfitobacteriaceae bacterium]
MDNEIKELNAVAQEIEKVARSLGLDFFPVYFEVCPAEALYTFGAYGMPVRFTHWSFGKAFHRLKTQYDLNLSRIYELVINSNPSYAFLLEGNKLIQNKLVIGHVYAHVDFFKNNRYFKNTPRDMVERMAAHAQQIRNYELQYGQYTVEKTIDAVFSIQEHVDPRSHIGRRKLDEKEKKLTKKSNPISSVYEDLWSMAEKEAEVEITKKVEYEDLLLYLIEHAPSLQEWQRDVVSMIRDESLYFYPQMETKIINEGWATFWHSRIMREIGIEDGETIDAAIMHSQVVQPSRGALNPYYLGVKIWEALDKKYDRATLFDVREAENDVSFIRNYLDKEIIEELNLFNFRKMGAQWQVTDTAWKKVRDNLAQQLVRGGNPTIVVCDGDYGDKGGLLLRHCHEGLDLDLKYLEKTLAYVQYLWGKPAYLETIMDNRKLIFECQNGQVTKTQQQD